MSVKVGNWPKLPNLAKSIAIVTSSFRTLGFANLLWRPEMVHTNGDSEIDGKP